MLSKWGFSCWMVGRDEGSVGEIYKWFTMDLNDVEWVCCIQRSMSVNPLLERCTSRS